MDEKKPPSHGETIIKDRPQEADALAQRWFNFVKNNPQYSLEDVESIPELYAWIQKHPEARIDEGEAAGLDVIKSYSELMAKEEGGLTPDFSALMLLPILAAAFRKSLILKEDHAYQKLLKTQKENWLKQNPGKTFENKEGLDYLYGNLENLDAATVSREIEEQFKEAAKTNPKMAKRLERYEKERLRVYKNLNDDPAVIRAKEQIEEHLKARLELAKKENQTVDNDALRTQVEERTWQDFAKEHVEKARSYAGSDKKIAKGFAKLPEEVRKEPSKHLEEEPQEENEEERKNVIEDAMKKYAKERVKKEVLENIFKKQPPPESFSQSSFEQAPDIPQETPSIPQPGEAPAQRPNLPRQDPFRGMQNLGRNASKMASNIGSKLGSGLSKAATGIAALGSEFWIIFGVTIGILVIVIVLIIITGGGAPGERGAIPGLSFNLEGPTKVNNGEQILYQVKNGSYLGTEDITFKDIIPANTTFFNATGKFTKQETDGNVTMVVWKLNDNVASTDELGQKTFWFSITLTPNSEDIIVENKIIAETSGSGGGGGGGGGSGNECTAPHEGSGYCSVENLKKYFGDSTNALIASLICQAESGSNNFRVNDNCGTNDYSVGLFQINLVAHCPGAYANLSCQQLIDVNKRNVCEAQYKDPEENIKKALGTFQGGGWGRWGVWNASVVDILNRCNIQYQ